MESFSSPRPTPKFFLEEKTFSTKKARGTPRDSIPPKPPVKSAPPISRIFPNRPIQRAQAVSFRSNDADASFLSTTYNENNKDLYFNQCFETACKLGAGSFGEVYKVKNKEDGRLYAVKRFHERFRGESDRQRKLEEVAKHETLPPHPNCVTFYKAWEERQHLYIQVELCQTSLNNYAESYHEIPEPLIWNCLVDLLMALKHLHDRNLVHMDIKPENIFVSYEGVCKLGDFGLVLDLSKGQDFAEAQEGDPKYLAPELMDGKFGKSADIFSLGMTILELASDLDLPRGGDGWHLLREGHVPEDFLRDKSFDLKYVIRQMLDPSPGSRPTVDQVLAFPSVRKVWKRRRRDYMIKSAISTVKSILNSILRFVFYITTVFMYPFQKLLPPPPPRPSISSESSRSRSHSTGCGLDQSISDDECFDNDISINNNSFGAPLDTSSSSETSDYSLPSKVFPRKAFTTPLVRHRPYDFVSSPLSSSPVLSSRSRKPSSPNASFESSFEEDRSLTPTFNVSGLALVDGDDNTKPGIEPKNLMGMFDEAASEDD